MIIKIMYRFIKDFKRKIKLNVSLNLDKYFFETVLMSIAVVMVWRGIWNFLDIYLFPNNFNLSNLVSIAIGLILLYLPDSENIERL